ncbi:MAG TPA: hypothetical protein VHR88_09155 [Solirubrobacteraceae bacterium]|jgi:hypothetical protein|nr:hypothetical protein [Solirubrobacteraceae bacterium]
MGPAGRVIAIVSALLVPLFLLLPFITVGPLSPRDYSGWQIYSGADIIVTLDGVAVIAVAVSAFFLRDSPVFGGVVVALGAFVLGHMLPEEIDPAGEIGIGAWLVNAAAVGIIVGGSLMLLDSANRWRRARRA